MNNLDEQYLKLLAKIIRRGNKKSDRTGVGTKSIFGEQIKHDMNEGFPILTSKKVSLKNVIIELLWFLNGDTNIKYLVDNNCNIWIGDAWKNYQKKSDNLFKTEKEFIEEIKNDEIFAKKWGELGPIYGKQWRNWGGKNNVKGIDQIGKLINDLKENPDSRRLLVSAWDVSEIENVVLPPCHYLFQCYTRELTPEERYKEWFNNNYETGFEYNESNAPDYNNSYWNPTPTRELSLMWSQRSVDTPLGLPYNITSYALLLIMLCQQTNMVAGELIANLGDCHIYSNQLSMAKKQLEAKTFNLPQIRINKAESIFDYKPEDFELINYQSSPTIIYPLSN